MAKISETIVETNLAGGPLTLADVAFEDNGSSPRRIGTLSIGCREFADSRITFKRDAVNSQIVDIGFEVGLQRALVGKTGASGKLIG